MSIKSSDYTFTLNKKYVSVLKKFILKRKDSNLKHFPFFFLKNINQIDYKKLVNLHKADSNLTIYSSTALLKPSSVCVSPTILLV